MNKTSVSRHRSGLRAGARAKGYLSVLFFLSALILVGMGMPGDADLGLWSGAMFALVAISVCVRAIIKGHSFFSSPIYPTVIVYALYVAVGPLLEKLPGLPRNPASTRSLVVAWSGFIALGIGYLLGGVRRRRLRTSSPGRVQVPEPLLLKGALIYTSVGGLALLAYIARSGGLGYFLESHYTTRVGGSAEGYAAWNPALYSVPIDMLVPGLLLFLCWMMIRRRSWYWGLAALLDLAVALAWLGPMHGTRMRPFVIVLSIACLLKFRTRRGGFMLRFGLYIVAAAAILGVVVLGAFREYSLNEFGQLDWSSLNMTQNTELQTALGVDAIPQTFQGIVDTVPESIPYLWGRTFYWTATILVPRALWPDKPYDLTIWTAENIDHVFAGVTSAPTWPGELYLNFGIPGVIAGMLLSGWILARIARWGPCSEAPQGFTLQALLYVTFYTLPLDMMRGGEAVILWRVFTQALPLYAVARWIGRKKKPRNVARTNALTSRSKPEESTPTMSSVQV